MPVMAIAWVITGFLTNLLPLFGESGLLLLGGTCFLLSFLFLLMFAYGHFRNIRISAATST